MPTPLPRVVHRQVGPPLSLTLVMDAELMAFQGHFPGRPILPGVVQVDWATQFAREAWGDLGTFTALDHLKFQDLVVPGDTVILELEHQPGQVRFRYTGDGAAKSSGLLRFSETP